MSAYRRIVLFPLALAVLVALCGPATLFSEVLTPESLSTDSVDLAHL